MGPVFLGTTEELDLVLFGWSAWGPEQRGRTARGVAFLVKSAQRSLGPVFPVFLASPAMRLLGVAAVGGQGWRRGGRCALRYAMRWAGVAESSWC